VALLALAPWATRVMADLNRWLARGLLGAAPVSPRLRALERARSEVASDAAATLRRIERDLHDGTQARLVAIAVSLAMADQALDADDRDRTQALLARARAQLSEATAELRLLTRGINPVALDGGLTEALPTLAADAGIATDLAIDLPERPSPVIERVVYCEDSPGLGPWDTARVTDMDSVVERFLDRLAKAGAREISPPTDRTTANLEALIDTIAPLKLPHAVERWWRLVDMFRFPWDPFPEPSGPDVALEMWKSYREEFVGVVPSCLATVAYSSMVVLSVELDQPGAPGGEIVRWAVDDGMSFDYVASSWTEVLKSYIDVLDAGAYTCDPRYGIVRPDEDVLDAALHARRVEAGPPGRYPEESMMLANPSQWPPHWQQADHIDPGDRRPRGRTLTIGEILAAPPGVSVEGTVVGRVIDFIGGTDRLVAVDDGTGVLDIFCPAAACLWGPAGGGEWEFDVTARADRGDPASLLQLGPKASNAGLSGDLPGARRAAEELARRLQRHDTAAVASVVRPAY
jgi:hypothetical protein